MSSLSPTPRLEAGVWHCAPAGAPLHWPTMQVRALVNTAHPLRPDAEQRAHARQRVRELLQHHAGPALASRLRSSPQQRQGPAPVSVSHTPGGSLLAWCERGYLGIDGVDMAQLAAADAQDLAATAALYLGPAWATTEQTLRPGADPLTRFAHAWARHEARLKCLGLGLVEWSPGLQSQLSAITALPLTLPGSAGPARWAAWLAWRKS